MASFYAPGPTFDDLYRNDTYLVSVKEKGYRLQDLTYQGLAMYKYIMWHRNVTNDGNNVGAF